MWPVQQPFNMYYHQPPPKPHPLRLPPQIQNQFVPPPRPTYVPQKNSITSPRTSVFNEERCKEIIINSLKENGSIVRILVNNFYATFIVEFFC